MPNRNGKKRKARKVAREAAGSTPFQECLDELDKWKSQPDPNDFPYHRVVDEYLRCGKHFVRTELLEKLDGIRTLLPKVPGAPASIQQLEAFLDSALDKRDERYDYTTYLAIDLLELPGEEESSTDVEPGLKRRDRLFVLLINDMLQFERRVVDGDLDLLPEMRPDARTVEKRYMWGLKAARPPLHRLGLNGDAEVDDSADTVRRLGERIDPGITEAERRLLQLTMQPVYVIHDEYMFLRVLQSFELTFSWIAVYIRTALEAFEDDAGEVLRQIDLATAMLKEASKVFPVLATMQRESFQTFRQFTEGASAIQSRNYKTVESLCRQPDDSRLNSIAYESVPEVRDALLKGPPNLDDAFRAACRAKRFTSDKRERIREAMRCFSSTLLRWKRTHYGIAVKMLGENPGTGYTEGTPYLKRVRHIPVFTSLEQNFF